MASQTVWYLNDTVINDYFRLINKENPDVYSFDTYFYERYSKSGYESVQRWTKRVNIFSKKKVFFPINIVRDRFLHWILVVADMEHKVVIYHDSLQLNYNSYVHGHILAYLGLEHRHKLGTSIPLEEWRLIKGDNPIQSNGRDCGVFVCTIAEYLSRDAPFNFSQKNMLSFRKLIAYELSVQHLFQIDADEDSIDDEINLITRSKKLI